MAASPSAPPSPTSSQGSFHEPNLEQLVDYLLASKRSLSSIQHVFRAREIVDSGREALEENAAVRAKNTFVRHALDKQVQSLEAIRYGAAAVDREGFDEFKATVQSLDAASARLNRTLESLRSALVESSFRPADDTPKHLIDFVDEAGIGDLEEAIKAGIDRFEGARSKLAETCETLDQDLERLQLSISPTPAAKDQTDTPEEDSPVPALFYQLETKATETASHLEGLVKHYDLCVTALKHTEGGGEAITQASTGEEPQTSALVGLGVDLGKMDEAPTKHISEEERIDLLTVLVKDSGEVEEVVTEIKESLLEMEDNLVQITTWIQGLRDTSANLREAMAFLKGVAGNLPNYISACVEFQRAWEDERVLLREKLEELEGLRDFYSGFEDAYDGLIIEVQRRKQARRDMEKVINAMMTELEALYNDDLEQRDTFQENQGEYIPSDLWPGLVNPPARFRVLRDEEDADEVLPDIKKSVFEKAVKRIRERQKPFKRAN